jgi:hypothetical protein
MNPQPYYDLILALGWTSVVLAGFGSVIGLASIYHDHADRRRAGIVPPERRVGPADRRAHAETR